MTEQTSGAYDDEPAPSGIVEAATRAQLGKRRATYPGTQPKGRSNVAATVTVVIASVLAVALFVAGARGWAILPVVLIVLILIGLLVDTSTAKKNKDLRLDLHEAGLTATIDGRVHAVRYDTTSVLQRHTWHTGTLDYHTYVYAFADVDEQSVVLRGRAERPEAGEIAERGWFSNPREWGPAILRGVTDAQLPQAVATLNAGKDLSSAISG